jgi:hypothetical protein
MNVDALVARARDEIATRHTFAAQMSVSDTRPGSSSRDFAAPVSAAADPEPPVQAASVEALMTLAGHAFVAQAYRAVLGREADGEGLEYHAEALREGRMTRADVLLSLAESAEGRARPQPLPGLAALGRKRARRTGFLGRWWAMLDFLREGPAMRVQLERREHQVAERERRLSEEIRALAGGIQSLAAGIQSLAADVDDVRAQVLALDESKAPREPSLHLAMHLAALQTRVKELAEAVEPK